MSSASEAARSGPLGQPRICCLDLDTFFVSVERLIDPSLQHRPVVVGGHRGGRGVVTSASYEVRAFGVRSGMSIREASELAPADAVFVPGNHELYGDYSQRAREIVERLSAIRPATIGQASRVPGVTPAAVSILLARVKQSSHR